MNVFREKKNNQQFIQESGLIYSKGTIDKIHLSPLIKVASIIEKYQKRICTEILQGNKVNQTELHIQFGRGGHLYMPL